MTLAGIYGLVAVTAQRPALRQPYVFLGAGEAGVGIGDCWWPPCAAKGSPSGGESRCWLVDSKWPGREAADRLELHKRGSRTITSRWRICSSPSGRCNPTVLIGVSGRREHVHASGRRGDGRAQRAAGDLCPVQSHGQFRVHRRASLCVERRTCSVRERKPVRPVRVPVSHSARVRPTTSTYSRVSGWE